MAGWGDREANKPWLSWLLFLLLLGSIYVFWVLPYQLPDRPVKVEFIPSEPEPKR